jgi:arylsulfatase A
MDYWDSHIERNGQVVPPDGQYLTDRLSEEAISFLRRHREEPFFLCLHYNAPHTPLQVPDGEEEDFLLPGINRGVATVYAMIRRLDRGVHRVLEALEDLGLTRSTCVFFTSDNGPQFGGQGENRLDRFNCNLAGSKTHVYEGGIRVPMIIRWPDGGLTGGGRMNQFVHYTDWLPTLMATAGTTAPAEPALDGINVLPALQGEAGHVNDTRFWQWNRYSPLRDYNAAMREGSWKLVRPAVPAALWTSPEEMAMDRKYERDPDSFPGPYQGPEPERDIPEQPPPPELYDLSKDPEERTNLADQNPARVSRMMGELEGWFRSVEEDRLSIRD